MVIFTKLSIPLIYTFSEHADCCYPFLPIIPVFVPPKVKPTEAPVVNPATKKVSQLETKNRSTNQKGTWKKSNRSLRANGM